jgi:hypothetical protein
MFLLTRRKEKSYDMIIEASLLPQSLWNMNFLLAKSGSGGYWNVYAILFES